MKKKVLLFSRDPGGSNTVIPLVKSIERKGYDVILYGKDISLTKYEAAGLFGRNIMDEIGHVDIGEIEIFLKKITPDFIITGTSASDFTEKYIWKAAADLNIPCFTILDHWINYGIRFSNYTLDQLLEYRENIDHPFLPDKILVMDDYAKEEMSASGMSTKKIEVTGQPYFEYLRRIGANISVNDIVSFKNELEIPQQDFLITFANEGISEVYRGTKSEDSYWGFTEKSILFELLSAMNSLVPLTKKTITLFIKLHPKQDEKEFSELIETFVNKKITIIIRKNVDPIKLILSSDLVCGMFSMFLIESVLLKRSIISILIGLKRDNPFILDKRGILKSVRTREELEIRLKTILLKNNIPVYDFEIEENAINNIITLMEQYLCQN